MNELMKGKKKKTKTNPELKHKIDITVRLRFFMVPSYLVGTALTCHFGTSMQCAQQPRGSVLSGFLVAFNMLSLLKDIPLIKKAAVSK